MMNSARVAALAFLAFVGTPAAAQDATAITSGTFTNVYLNPAQDTSPVYSGVGTNSIEYGEPAPGWSITYNNSGPVDYSTVEFFLGSITAFNGSIFTDSGISGLDLFLRTVIAPPVNPGGDGLGTTTELITIFSTPNTDDPIASADYLGFESLSVGAWTLEGTSATFNLFGTVNSPLTITRIEVAQGSENTGFVTEVGDYPFQLVRAVPEPGTWAMMLLGFGFVGAAMRRRRPQIPRTNAA